MFLAESSVLSSLTSISESFSFFFDNFRAFTLLHRLQITISSKLYRCMTLKYFFYHQIFFQDSAQTEKLTVFSNPKYTAWTFWNTEHEHFEILSMKLNCKYWECMDWNPRNTDVPTSVFRRYCDTYFEVLCITLLSFKNFILHFTRPFIVCHLVTVLSKHFTFLSRQH